MRLINEDPHAYIEQLKDYFRRNTEEMPEELIVSDRVSKKITDDGQMKPFYGYTSVIKLSAEDIAKCEAIYSVLFARHGDMLVRLKPETFHLTIHAFCNVYSAAEESDEVIEREMKQLEPLIREELIRIGKLYRSRGIRMKALGLSAGGKDVNSLKFMPETEQDGMMLIDLFNRFEMLYPLGKPFIPHISFGYFKLRKFASNEIQALYRTMGELNEQMDLTISLDLNQLAYQRHYHMNDFRDVYRVGSLMGEDV